MTQFLICILFFLVLAALGIANKKPPVVVKSGRVRGVEFSTEKIHHSGSFIRAYYLVYRTVVVFMDGARVPIRESGRFSWKAGTELTILSRDGSQEFSVEPEVDRLLAQEVNIDEFMYGYSRI
ncbi:MAG: hypothetical protein LiPW15_685 [Parcubacteria group bacterium LiPW_15]|nr:MAG: hypothetical protein LiPW15_685 [Parcubacteria group bacterium LiPW_15]